jgi:hypothetical protein
MSETTTEGKGSRDCAIPSKSLRIYLSHREIAKARPVGKRRPKKTSTGPPLAGNGGWRSLDQVANSATQSVELVERAIADDIASAIEKARTTRAERCELTADCRARIESAPSPNQPIGGTMLTSPTPLAPYGCAGFELEGAAAIRRNEPARSRGDARDGDPLEKHRG